MMHFKVNDQTCIYMQIKYNANNIKLHKYFFIGLDTSCDIQSGGDDKLGPDKNGKK